MRSLQKMYFEVLVIPAWKFRNTLQMWYCSRNFFETYMWQSRIEIEYYFIAYFERITEFDAL